MQLENKNSWQTKAKLRKILQHKRHLKASHWDPCKLTNFSRHFGEDS